jgi:peptidoglycan/xylan/chitin deacetylase (PgdA/CDA1 family)
MKKLLLFICLTAFTLSLPAQDTQPWKNKKCAVSLTYDDALNVHLDNVIPLLDSLHLQGTFYLSTFFPGFYNRIEDWKKVAKSGHHELGNHCIYHPCTGRIPGRDWVKPEQDLSTYTVQRMRDELRMNNYILQILDGKTRRSFAYPCGDMKIGDSLYLDKKDFASARGVQGIFPPMDKIDLYNVGAFSVVGQTGEQLINQVKQAMANNSYLVFLFHGVGGEHSLNVSLEAHRQLLVFLKQHEKEIWIAPFIEITEYVKTTVNK